MKEWMRTILFFAAFNLAWEVLQLPFYTIWGKGGHGEIINAVLHCTAGDVLIGTGVYILSRYIMRLASQSCERRRLLPACFVVLSLAYTVFSEWLNVHVFQSWAYSGSMPVLPPFGTGLTPALQWIIVPALTWITAGDHVRSKLAGRMSGVEGGLS